MHNYISQGFTINVTERRIMRSVLHVYSTGTCTSYSVNTRTKASHVPLFKYNVSISANTFMLTPYKYNSTKTSKI